MATSQSCSFHSHLTAGDRTDNNIISSASVAYNTNQTNIQNNTNNKSNTNINISIFIISIIFFNFVSNGDIELVLGHKLPPLLQMDKQNCCTMYHVRNVKENYN